MLEAGDHDVRARHLVFNPGRPSHPRARKVHSYSDAELAQQDQFSDHAADLRQFFEHDGIVVAHNASFDKRFIAKEFSAAGFKSGARDYFCTMLAHRRQYGEKSGLDAVLTQMGRGQRSGHHGALRDAWHAGQVYCWLHNYLPFELPTPVDAKPVNYRTKPTQIATAPVTGDQYPPQSSTTNSPALERAMARLHPMAKLLMTVARADGDFSVQEVETITLFIESRMEHEDFALSGDEYLDLLDFLCGSAERTDFGLELACRTILKHPNDRDELSWWIRQMTYADGSGSVAEQAAILMILEAMRSAKHA